MSGMNFLERLLDGVAVEWKPLGEVAIIGTGSRNTNEAVLEGKYPFFVRSQEPRAINEYEFDETAIITAGDGVGVGKVFHFITGKYALHQRAYRILVTTGDVIPKFLFHFIRFNFSRYLATTSVHASVTSLRKPMFEKYPVPVPPLKVQAEIVRILDTFTALTAELTAELTDRKKQDNYYRDRLLAFEEGEVEWKPLGEIGEFIRGKRFTKADYVDDGIQAIHYGEIYTHYGVSASRTLSQVRSELAASLRYADTGDVVIAGVGETVEDVGKAVAWIGSEKVAFHDDSWAFRHSINPKFVSYVMQTTTFINEKTKHVSSGKVKRLLINGIEKVRIPIPYPNDPKKSVAEQARIVAILDKFDTLTHSISEGLPREIALRQKQYEYYRDLLLSFPKTKEEQ
jgi:type I restriction enzyme S subunit